MEIVRPIVQECFIPAQYTSSPEIIKNCLQEVLSEGMMYSQVSAPADNEDMTRKQRENIIKKHMEQKQYAQLENGKWKRHLEVVEHTKSDAGYRTLYVVSSALELFDKVREANMRNGYSCEAEDYIFMYRKHRITANSIDSHYERYCKQIGIAKKGNHKARKTALTKVADNPYINLKDAMEFAGHRDVKTFINHYCFSRYSDEQKRQELKNARNTAFLPISRTHKILLVAGLEALSHFTNCVERSFP